MIRILTEKDRDAVVRLLERSRRHNIYMLGNLEKHGFDAPFCQFWGDFAASEQDGGAMRAALNRYMNGWSVFGVAEADWGGLAGVLDGYPEPGERLQDNPGGVVSFLPFLRRYEAQHVSEEELMELAAENFRPAAATAKWNVRRAEPADLDELAAFYADAGHMARSRAGVERPLRHTRVWVASIEGAIRAAALTNAEAASMGMIGGVYTMPEWRGRGLSQAVCSALCADLIGEGVVPLLYWDTPAAGAVYRKLGFRRIGVWRSAWLARS